MKVGTEWLKYFYKILQCFNITKINTCVSIKFLVTSPSRAKHFAVLKSVSSLNFNKELAPRGKTFISFNFFYRLPLIRTSEKHFAKFPSLKEITKVFIRLT
jgi:hypothetical protein